MQLTFLEADKPLTKKYTKRPDGGYDSESYPMLFRVSSHVENVHSIEEFAEALEKHAELGHCLHTGSLDRQLTNESRKGHHDKDEAREWIVLDLDGLTGFNGVDELIAELPSQFNDVSYIVQESPSSGIKPGLRAHVFFMLDQPVNMADVKTWVMEANLVTEKLRDEITLTAKDFALSYPLDRIANDNGRVVYITPPECVGFQDPVGDRVRVVAKARERLPFNFRGNIADIKAAERKHIDDLRAAKGLPKKRTQDYYEIRAGHEILKKTLTEPGRVHPVRQDSDIVMRCNLDDGDSEAYFYYIDRPQKIRNHKGEPQLWMEAVDPKFYHEVALPAAQAMWEKDKQAFVFRNTDDDRWYQGTRIGDKIVDQPHQVGSEPKYNAWFRQHSPHVVPPDPDQIETWTIRFDPRMDKQWNPDKLVFNTWRKTALMSDSTYRSLPPKTITHIIQHVVGGGAEEYERFINWLAYVCQYRQKTGTAWIFHGVQGTGKGLLVDRILTPLLGHDYVTKVQSRNLKAEFNSFLEKSLIVNLDEFDLYDAGGDANAVMQALKMWITDSRFNIRRMHTNHLFLENFSNFIITTNSMNSIPIPVGDRRFSFGLRQEERLQVDPEILDIIEEELPQFAGYIMNVEVNKHLAHVALENEAKARAMELSRNTMEEFASAVLLGDLRYFVDLSREHVDASLAGDMGTFKNALNHWITDAKAGNESAIAVEDLLSAYKVMTGNSRQTGTKFKKAMEHKSAPARRTMKLGKTKPYGWVVEWNVSDEDRANMGLHITGVKSTSEPEKDELQAPSGPPTMRT